ncbi:unnamed protein product, partial [Durusdinium trenchii]
MITRCHQTRSLPRYGSPPDVKEQQLRAVATVADLRRALKLSNERRSQDCKNYAPERFFSAKDTGRAHVCESEVSLTQAVVVPAKMQIAVQRIRRRHKPKKKIACPTTIRVGRLLPSVQECLNKFWSDEVNSDDLLRMRVVFRSMSEDGLHVLCDDLPELMMRCGFHTLSEEKCKKLVQEVTVFDYMDFQDFTDFSEKAILEERKGYRQLLKTWEPNSCDNFVDPVDNVKSFMKMLKVICTRKSVLDILDVAGLKARTCIFFQGTLKGKKRQRHLSPWQDEPCNSPQEMLRFLAAYQACEGFSKQEVSSLRAAFKSCEEKPHAVGPEGRLIDPKSLSFGLLRFGGIYFVEAWRAMKHYQKASAAGVSFYEFLVCARRVRETQLQQVAEYVETICGEGENFIEELRSLCRPLGFTLQKVEVVEICQEKGIGLDGPLSLDCAWDFAEHVRSCHGFRKAEQAELVQSFLKFSQGEAELAVLKILELLNWLGLGGALEEAHQMLRQVDFNDNGVLDETEFLRLMRLQKERNLVSYTSAYCRLHLGDAITRSRIFAALAECDIFTENHLLEVITLKHGIKTASVNFSHAGVRRGSGKQPGISWDTWVILAEEARKVTPVWKRRSASFKEAEVSELRKAFGAEEVPVSDLIWMLLDSG